MEFYNHNVKTNPDSDLEGIIFDFVDLRTEDIGSSILGCFIVWGLTDALCLYMLFTGERPDCKNERDGYEPTDKN